MILSKFFPHPRKRGAVFTTILLIGLALLIGISLSLIPYILAALNVPEDKRKIVDSFLPVLIPVTFVIFSWDMVNDIVGGAITTESRNLADEEIEKYKEKCSSERSKDRQVKEFLAIIPQDNRFGEEFTLSIEDYDNFKDIKRKFLVRDSIFRSLFFKELLLKGIALESCRRVLGMNGCSNEELRNDHHLQVFREDIYIYLQAWLLLSIRNGRMMEIGLIKQRYPSEELPDRYAYTKAIEIIRDSLIDDPVLEDHLEKEYLEDAIKALKYYLDHLHRELEINATKPS